MSKEIARKFLDRVEADANFREKIIKFPSNEERKSYLKEEKFIFSEKDLNEAMQDKYHTKMTKEEMAKVVAAGGQGPTTSPDVLKAASFSCLPIVNEQ